MKKRKDGRSGGLQQCSGDSGCSGTSVISIILFPTHCSNVVASTLPYCLHDSPDSALTGTPMCNSALCTALAAQLAVLDKHREATRRKDAGKVGLDGSLFFASFASSNRPNTLRKDKGEKAPAGRNTERTYWKSSKASWRKQS